MTHRQIIACIIWWTEGTKSSKDKRWKNSFRYNVELTNTNPDIIRIFLDFLREDIGIQEDRLKLQLQIHEGDEQEQLEKLWSKATNIPRERFNRTIIRPKGNKPGRSRGTCKIRYCDKAVYKKLESMLKEIVKETGRSSVG